MFCGHYLIKVDGIQQAENNEKVCERLEFVIHRMTASLKSCFPYSTLCSAFIHCN